MSSADGASSAAVSKGDLLLFHGLMVVAHPGGEVNRQGLATLETFFNTLPEFRDKDFDELLRAACTLQAEHGSLHDSIEALAGLDGRASRLKMFVLAVDLAMSAGPLDGNGEKLLETLTEALDIDEETAVKVVTVLNLKYRT